MKNIGEDQFNTPSCTNMSLYNSINTPSYTTSTTNMYNKDTCHVRQPVPNHFSLVGDILLAQFHQFHHFDVHSRSFVVVVFAAARGGGGCFSFFRFFRHLRLEGGGGGGGGGHRRRKEIKVVRVAATDLESG